MRLIHTGGTIGMVPSPQGLVPAMKLVEAAVGERARVTVLDPLVDSAAIGAADWNRLLDLIETADDPVIVTHGTDTMAYTGAALSQALAGRDAPVILCGAMAPLGTGGDAEANLDLALSAQPGPGVWLAFADRLIPAAGLVKHDSHGADSFRAVPQAPLSLPPARRFSAARIGILTLTPGIPAAMVAAALSELDGCVLRVFGAGTAPPDPALYRALSEAHQRGCALRAVSVCEAGGLVPGAYAAGAALWGAGVQNGGLDTAEAAFVRLWLHHSKGA
ncbi:Asparaginase [Roseovarius sp. TM1035]|jgi:L-asparaginase|uniref:asparaginase n=1 Tax=Roseovarius sp. TM1035 TaxID=391613 RepID=UPI0001556DC4|nr:asparaginase domain-containing protein [Roseovarius sp. TM1035]EDM30960.1 Asparaginase [Roseovarius sp. TM1035]